MANTVNIFKTETELKLIIAELLKRAGSLGGDTHYTDEGKAESGAGSWSKRTLTTVTQRPERQCGTRRATSRARNVGT